jgi:hypothetical protein
VLSSNIIRWSGLAAMVAAPLYIVADLLGLFTVSFQGPADGLILQNIVAPGAGVLLLLGLIAMYVRYLEAMGTLSLAGLAVTLLGLILATGIFIWAYSLGEQGWGLFFVWASLLANLGWILFGAVSIDAQLYPREAAIILVVGAVLYGVANALVGSAARSGTLVGGQNYVVGVLIFNIVFNVAIALFGFGLFRRRKAEDQYRPRLQ